jgi:hypothetical protein
MALTDPFVLSLSSSSSPLRWATRRTSSRWHSLLVTQHRPFCSECARLRYSCTWFRWAERYPSDNLYPKKVSIGKIDDNIFKCVGTTISTI